MIVSSRLCGNFFETYGKRYWAHLFSMKCILFFSYLSLLMSCKGKEQLPKPAITDKITPKNFTCDYSNNKQRCKQLYKEYRQDPTFPNDRKLILFLRDSLLPCWYGTPWGFYGTTEEPGKGSIACGYFVTTVLRDAGFSLQRIKLAQCPSEEMIKTICTRSSIHRYSDLSLSEFASETGKMGFGLYVVGLDNHTGFILNDGNEAYFIHSTFIKPTCVIKEKVNESKVLANSRYRVIGKVNL